MTSHLAQIIAQADIQNLSLVGLAKNVGKTTTTNHILETLLSQKSYCPEELALTSLGLDGEATDALNGLPKPHYIPKAGLLIATADELLRHAERQGIRVERLFQLPGRSAIGPIVLARVLHPGRVIIAGPTLLRILRGTLVQLHEYGARLTIIDGAINRIAAASPAITDACLLSTGASAAATPELVAQSTADIFARLTTPQSTWHDVYKKQHPQTRLSAFSAVDHEVEYFESFSGQPEPAIEARWIVEHAQKHRNPFFFLRGAFTEELSEQLLVRLTQISSGNQFEIVVGDGTKIFCHSTTLEKLAARRMYLRVAEPIRILALTLNPYTPEYSCTSQELLAALLQALPAQHPPILDLLSGLCDRDFSVTS